MAVSVYTGAGGGVASFNGRTGKVVPANGDYTKAQVGLGNVDNTSDANKPISKATQAALNNKQSKITANGILKGDGTGTITAADETEVELVDLPEEIFWAQFGSTTQDELDKAYNEGQLIMLYKSNAFYFCGTRVNSGSTYRFYNIIPTNYGSYRTITFYNGEWQNPVLCGTICDRIVSLTLPATEWTGSNPYTQQVLVTGKTADTKVDIQPSETLYDQLVADNVGYLAIKNVDGTLTAVAKGGKPSVDLTVQVTYNNVY